jgi:Arc/MetJ-type ribon-helix-helix transcriptional regulator
MEVVTVRVDEKTRKELDQVVEELGGSTSEVIRKAIHLAWFTTMQDRMRRESAEIASDRRSGRKPKSSANCTATLFRKGSVYLITLPTCTGDHAQEGRR